jgi:hypothetical protein
MAYRSMRAPARRHYLPVNNEPLPCFALPFIRGPRTLYEQPNFWDLPPNPDFTQAFEHGCEFTAHLAQFLKDNPHEIGTGLLGYIAKSIDYTDPDRSGYWVGFFTIIEHMLAAQAHSHPDIFAAIDAHLARERAACQEEDVE